MNVLSSGIYLLPEHWAQMLEDVTSRQPVEACGFVLGSGNRSKNIIPVTNILHDPFRFRMDPQEELYAFLLAEQKGLEILAVYHSHPHGINKPSATDFNELTFPEILYLIWYVDSDHWQCRAYLMQADGGAGEVPVIVSTNM